MAAATMKLTAAPFPVPLDGDSELLHDIHSQQDIRYARSVLNAQHTVFLRQGQGHEKAGDKL